MTPAEQAWQDSHRTDTRGKYAFIAGWEAGRAAGLREALAAEPNVSECLELGFGLLGGKSWALWVARLLELQQTKEIPHAP